jgi:hypothetical protein
MVDIVKLKALIDQPPYDTMTDAELVAALNAPTETVHGNISKATLLQWAGANAGFTTINSAATYSGGTSEQNLAVQNAGMAAQALFSGGDVPEFDTGSFENQSMLSLFVAVGLMTQAAMDSLIALGTKMETPAQVAGIYDYVNYGDIAEARAL